VFGLAARENLIMEPQTAAHVSARELWRERGDIFPSSLVIARESE
jgi:hypothetical protein